METNTVIQYNSIAKTQKMALRVNPAIPLKTAILYINAVKSADMAISGLKPQLILQLCTRNPYSNRGNTQQKEMIEIFFAQCDCH